MPKVISIATAEPKTIVGQEEVKEFARGIFSQRRDDVGRLLNVFNNTSILSRHFTEARSWYGMDHGFAERNELYIRNAVELSEECSIKCLNEAGMEPADIHHVIFVSSTGLSTPSIDARLFNTLSRKNSSGTFNEHVKRTPIWGLGCAGGAAGLSRALEYTNAMPAHAVLLIAIELCGLTFQKDDYSKNNLVGTSLFSDGTAASIIVGDQHSKFEQPGVSLLNSLSTIFDNSLDVMGWDVKDNGLKVIFSKDIPTIVCNCLRQNIEELAKDNGINLSDIKHFVVHPGGPKVMDAYEQSLSLQDGALRFSREVLSKHGNMSSPTVLYVLKGFIERGEYKPNEYGLISALGPGFSSELVLFKTN